MEAAAVSNKFHQRQTVQRSRRSRGRVSQINQLLRRQRHSHPHLPIRFRLQPRLQQSRPRSHPCRRHLHQRQLIPQVLILKACTYDGYKRKKGSKIHIAVDTLGLLLAAHVTPANEQERAQVKELADAVQDSIHNSVEVAFVNQGYTGGNPKNNAHQAGAELIVVKLEETKKGFILLPRRWVVERSFAWIYRFRRLARDCDRTPETIRSLHFLAFAIFMVHNFVKTIAYIL